MEQLAEKYFLIMSMLPLENEHIETMNTIQEDLYREIYKYHILRPFLAEKKETNYPVYDQLRDCLRVEGLKRQDLNARYRNEFAEYTHMLYEYSRKRKAIQEEQQPNNCSYKRQKREDK
jgi:hypothetical protein